MPLGDYVEYGEKYREDRKKFLVEWNTANKPIIEFEEDDSVFGLFYLQFEGFPPE